MFGKNRKKKVGICVMVVTSCFILAALWAVLATPETALAHKDPDDPDHSHGKGGGGDGDGACCSLNFCITFRDGENDAIGSDVFGSGVPQDEYCNGKKIVAIAGGPAATGCGFRLDMNKGKQFGQGRLGFLDLSDCVDGNVVVDVGVDWSDLVELQFRFIKQDEADDTEDDGDPIGAGGLDLCSLENEGDTATVPMWISVGDASGNSVSYLIVFGAPYPPIGREGEVGSNSEPVTVTRKPDLPDGRRVWTIESFATTNNDGAAVRNTDNEEVLCNLPFLMTLTEQP